MTVDFEYQYKSPSIVETVDNEKSFLLSHCSEVEKDNDISCFFYGNITNSFEASKCLSVLGKTVRSHFAITPEQRLNMRDPIVSVGSEQLHFEGFSSCNSVYAKVYVRKEGIDGEFIQSGCTNVDFNDHTIRAFNTMGRSDRLVLGVGAREISFITESRVVTEKKVSLPDRWIKGLGNVQVHLSQMKHVFELSKIEAMQLFRQLPKSPVKGYYYLFKSGHNYGLSSVPKSGSLRIGGVHRLQVIENLLLSSESLSFYQGDDQQSAAIVVNFKTVQFLLLLSDGVYRGFSGEGKHAEKLLSQIPEEWIIGVNTYFKTNEIFQPALIAVEHDIQFVTMDALTASLSSMGLLGFDLQSNNHFYRRLPFKLSRMKSFNPRLQNAMTLLAKEGVVILQNNENGIKAEVDGSSDMKYIVAGKRDNLQCTCAWFTNHQVSRGLCKHILAVKMIVDDTLSE